MLSLLRRTLTLFRRQPIFWVPLLFVTLALIGLDDLRRVFQLQVVRWLMTSNTSVLSSTPEHNATPAVYTKALLIGAPLEWATVVLGIFLHIFALIMTAALVRSFLIGTRPSLHNAFQDAMFRKLPALWLSLKLFLFVQLFEPLAFFLLSRVPQIAAAMTTRSGLLLFGVPIHLGWQVFVAIYFAPSALALLRREDDEEASPRAIHEARILAILAIFTTAILTYLLVLARPALLTRLQSSLLLNLSIPMLASVPLLLLYLSLSLVSCSENSPQFIQPAGSID